MVRLSLAVWSTLAYADVFNYPLRAPEVWRFLISPQKASLQEVKEELLRLKAAKKCMSVGGYYFLAGRDEVVKARRRRAGWNQEKLNKARRAGWWLKMVPWIKMTAVTGALAMDNADQDDDIDFLIITDWRRLWLTRLLAVFLMELTGQRRRPQSKRVKDKICLNMFLDQQHLTLPPKERNLFTAHEAAQLKPLWEKSGAYRKFLAGNQWVGRYLVNGLGAAGPRGGPAAGKKKTWLNCLISQGLGCLELLAYRFQLVYMRPRQTMEITAPGRIRFHPRDCSGWILSEYRKRCQKVLK